MWQIKITNEKKVNTPIWMASALKSIKRNWAHTVNRDLRSFTIRSLLISYVLNWNSKNNWNSHRKLCNALRLAHIHVCIVPMTFSISNLRTQICSDSYENAKSSLSIPYIHEQNSCFYIYRLYIFPFCQRQ